MIFSNRSLSGYILTGTGVLALMLLVALGVVLVLAHWSPWNIAIALLCVATALAGFILRFRRRILSSFERALLHIEAVKMEDYGQHAKSNFEQGCSAEFHRELVSLSESLQSQKSRYDQHAMLLYQLIDQLDTPMMVFNQRQQLTYANLAFSHLYGQPWQMLRQASPSFLGLERQPEGWRLAGKGGQWQVSQSEFIDAGEKHILLVCTNIDSAVRETQTSAWQQIIRVLSHEIRNSLTPVSSLAESLSARLQTERERQALAMISERCLHLQDFVDRYSSLSQVLKLDRKIIDGEGFFNRLQALFPQLTLEVEIRRRQFEGDETFLQQVLINLLKNAEEAGATNVECYVGSQGRALVMRLQDNGQGFANMDNLFVPLFTTKQQGQGIGLTLCRRIVEAHGGQIDLTNNTSPVPGVTVTLQLPQPD